jgi:maltokinase
LRAAIESAPRDTTALGYIHGDLHIGQLVAWRGGLDVIDFDGAPEPTAPAGDLDTPTRDVAQMLCSLWILAAVVDRRTDGAHGAHLRDWAERAEVAFLAAYRQGLDAAGSDALDQRLLEPLMAEQFCRELIYADATLPRWRYAPMRALRWRYPLRHRDDV